MTKHGPIIVGVSTVILALSQSAHAFALPVNALAAESKGSSGGDGTSRPIAADIANYAQAYGVDEEEAARRHDLMAVLADAVGGIRLNPSFGGLWVTHDPVFSVVLATTGPDLRDELPTSVRLYATHQTVQYSFSELQDAAESLAVPRDGELFDVVIDEPANEVQLLATPATIAPLEERLESTNELEGPVQVVETSEIARPSATIWAGLSLSTCTSGFSVRNSAGTTGILTAGHCSNSQSYSGTSLPYVNERYSGSRDVQWHTTPGLDDRNWAYDGQNDSSSPYYRFITATSTRSAMFVGQTICKYGKTTGYGCGEIYSLDYKPSYVPSGSGTFALLARSGVDLSQPGDSGGPFFSGNTAFGLMSGQAGDSAIMMPINYATVLGVSVLTSS